MNIARYFVENRQVGWVVMFATLIWGVVAYTRLPQRKDPEIVIKTAVINTAWPGAKALDVEQLITRPIELAARQVARVDKVTSTTRTGMSTIFVTLEDTVKKSELETAWSDLKTRLELIEASLPTGSTKPLLNTHFGDTAAVVYSVASPTISDVELNVRADLVKDTLKTIRSTRPSGGRGATLFIPAESTSRETIESAASRYVSLATHLGAFTDAEVVYKKSFVAIDYAIVSKQNIEMLNEKFKAQVSGAEQLHPDVRGPFFIEDLETTHDTLSKASLQKYSYKELDSFSTLLRDELSRLSDISRVDRHGVVPEKIYLAYSQERLASFGISPRSLGDALKARNVLMPGGAIGTGLQSILVAPPAAITDIKEILDTVAARSPDGRAVYVRDLVTVQRTYETPLSDVSWFTTFDGKNWNRNRAVSLAVHIRSGRQVTKVGEDLDAALAKIKSRLPHDLRIEKTSNQPELVSHKIGEFMRSLAEAVAIVIAVALLFMERRSAILVAASIPLTLAMTFGFMDLFKIDLQQVSIAALIISLGLLVDDPVIAGDAINREIANGVPKITAAWQGPTKLARAIFFATLTNIVAFAPLLLVTGTMGEFIYGLPMVVSLSLIASRIVSMTFMPLLGYYLLKGQKGFEAALEGNGSAANFARKYNAITEWMLDHKGKSFAAFLAFLVIGLAPVFLIKTQFFPEEALSRFYIHVRLPEGADIRATEATTRLAHDIILRDEGKELKQITTYVGNGGPRWWSNVAPDPKNAAYALMILEAHDAEATMPMIGRLQRKLKTQVPGARFEVYRLSSGKPAVTPVEVRISGDNIDELRIAAEKTKSILLGIPQTADVSDDWGAETLNVELSTDDARASAAGVTNADISSAVSLAYTGAQLTQLREGDRMVDVTLKLRPEERANAARVKDLYVWGSKSGRAVPMEQVTLLHTSSNPKKIVRYNQLRTITIGAIPHDGELASTIVNAAKEPISKLKLPEGFTVEFGGEQEAQAKAFATVSIALKVSIALIFMALVWQFASVFKPLIVFAAIPFGMVGVVLGLVMTKTNFGFMAFLGVASLIGVIVSHIIVLFDFIEEAREHGEPLHRAVIDAGLVRLRPVLVTVLATVGGLIPLALEGGPMWRQLVYVQIGGLLLATLVTKGVVPLLYVVFVEKFKLIDWSAQPHQHGVKNE